MPCFLVAASLFPCLTHIVTALSQDSMLEQTETLVVMLTELLFEKKQMLIKSNEKKMSGAAGAQLMCCRCAVGARSGAAGWPASRL